MTQTSPPPPPPAQPPPGSSTGPRVTRDQIRDLSTLRRDRDDKVVAGVAAGIARHLDVDPILIRVLFGALTLFGGAGLLLYAIAWIAMPEDGAVDSPLANALHRDPTRVMYGALVVAAAIGAIAVFSSIGFVTPHPAPVILTGFIIVATIAYLSRRRDRQLPPPTPGAPYQYAAVATTPQTAPAAAPTPTAGTSGAIETDVQATGDEPSGMGDGDGPPTAWQQLTPPPPIRPKRPRSHLFAVTMAVIAIAMGGLWIADATGSDIAADVYPATALAITAAALIVGAWFGRSRLLIFVGILAALATTAAAAVGPGAIGQRTYEPTSASALNESYKMAIGQQILRLGDIADTENLNGKTVSMHSKFGQIEVVVPTSIDVSISAHTDHGDIRGLANVQNYDEGERRVTGPDGPHALYLDLDVDFGEIVVKRIDCPTLGSDPTPPPVSATTLSQITMTTTGGIHVPACN